jgi:hypothetical protein
MTEPECPASNKKETQTIIKSYSKICASRHLITSAIKNKLINYIYCHSFSHFLNQLSDITQYPLSSVPLFGVGSYG